MANLNRAYFSESTSDQEVAVHAERIQRLRIWIAVNRVYGGDGAKEGRGHLRRVTLWGGKPEVAQENLKKGRQVLSSKAGSAGLLGTDKTRPVQKVLVLRVVAEIAKMLGSRGIAKRVNTANPQPTPPTHPPGTQRAGTRLPQHPNDMTPQKIPNLDVSRMYIPYKKLRRRNP